MERINTPHAIDVTRDTLDSAIGALAEPVFCV